MLEQDTSHHKPRNYCIAKNYLTVILKMSQTTNPEESIPRENEPEEPTPDPQSDELLEEDEDVAPLNDDDDYDYDDDDDEDDDDYDYDD
ncbi:hypothetical protein OGAPHI_004160 [Ogataea philodendri]|uniref:Uncharacterized protein n=1 Tax=Ogataea philodendri TaxID=1378263 RepID=A0A9P8T4Q4_9ASCO|nr:uncharacterized protein OGAPHI_004160 [Ogataea philodendri]KAH3665971.1 hypothetical protein OGAPHI_004160 [Ogataea philodendri]